jgi:hypothetical protein
MGMAAAAGSSVDRLAIAKRQSELFEVVLGQLANDIHVN